MAMKQRFFNILIILLLLLPYHAEAGDGLTPINFKGVYEFSFAGLPFGQMGVEIEQSSGHYAITSDVTLTGIIRMFVQHKSHTTVEANGGDIHYEAHYQTRKKKHYVRLDYKNGLLKEEEQIPPETHAKRPEVPMKLKQDSSDPLSALLKARQGLWQAQKSGKTTFSVNVYDGNRLTGADFTILGKSTLRYGDKTIPVIKISARRKLLSGFTESELSDYDPKEPPLILYFTDDNRLLPLKVEMIFLASPLTATLAKECLSGESCLLGIRE